MDSLTHIALGAVIGDALLGRRLGKRALWIGALAQSLPDLDFIASTWSSSSAQLLTHRGWTHSLSFDLLAGLLLATLFHRLFPDRSTWKRWLFFFLLQVSLHLFLDFFNSYSIGLLEPFSHRRFSYPVLYVVDPLFSLGPVLAALALLILRSGARKRALWQRAGLAAAFLYLALGWWHKSEVEAYTARSLRSQGIGYQEVRTIPTPFNHWLWYIVARADSGFYISYHSVFDRRPESFVYHPKNRQLLQAAPDSQELNDLLQFAEGNFLLEQRGDTLVFSDLRFGQILGWEDARRPFVFQYYLGKGDAVNRLALQRGRLTGWSGPRFRRFLQRIGGN